MPFLARPGFSMHYEVVEGALPHDTIFLHGNLAANLWWEPAREVWAAERKPGWTGRMVLAEWRGLGGSAGASGPFELPNLAADVNALTDALGLASPRLVGHSTGGIIGLYALAADPKRYARALLLDSVTAAGVPFGPEALETFRQMGRDRRVCAAVLLSTIHGGEASEAFRERLVDAAFHANAAVWEGVPTMLKPPLPPLELSEITTPTLVLHGARDAVIPVAAAEAFAARLPRSQFQAFPERGHCPNVEEPALFVRTAHEFLYD